jgi:hypothetical protein
VLRPIGHTETISPDAAATVADEVKRPLSATVNSLVAMMLNADTGPFPQSRPIPDGLGCGLQ